MYAKSNQAPRSNFKHKEKLSYGLEATDNRKTGPAFALPPADTCTGRTQVCWQNCYKKGITYNNPGSIAKRERNLNTVEMLLSLGGSELLAQALIELIDEHKPKDWLVAKTIGAKTFRPWTFRIHDLGDFYRSDYIEAWILAVSQRPDCRFWFYTRSFSDSSLYPRLTKLAELANCQGFISIDADNWMRGITCYRQDKANIWKLALLQTPELPDGLLASLRIIATQTDVVNFPLHNGPHHIEPLHGEPLMNCPSILGAFPLADARFMVPPCQRCQICLPGAT